MTCWIIGNGESRLPVDLDLLPNKIGCNAVHRDTHIDHLICVDRKMVEESLPKKDITKIYTRSDWASHYKVNLVPELPYQGTQRPDDPWHWGSGPFAVLLGAMLFEKINLLGFDLHSKNNKVNNVYKNTANYSSADKRPVDPRYWIYQIAKVFECYPSKQFTIYNNDDWIIPDSWKKSNVLLDNISNI
ncbi:MAG: hypothetical protein VW235_11635 [Rhodospirillaceae bacterium]|jgi:hypothetical protein